MPLQIKHRWIWKTTVKSSCGRRNYIVSLGNDGLWGCSCPGWTRGRHECRHIHGIQDEIWATKESDMHPAVVAFLSRYEDPAARGATFEKDVTMNELKFNLPSDVTIVGSPSRLRAHYEPAAIADEKRVTAEEALKKAEEEALKKADVRLYEEMTKRLSPDKLIEDINIKKGPGAFNSDYEQVVLPEEVAKRFLKPKESAATKSALELLGQAAWSL